MKVEKIEKNVDVTLDPIKSVIASTQKTENVWPIDNLPSQYKLYPEGTKILGRPLKVQEIKMLSTLNEDNVNFVLNDVLGRAITGIRVEDLIIADKLYIIFWLRANTYKDSSYKIDFKCPDCGTKDKYEFQLDALKIKYLSEKYNETEARQLPSGRTAKIKQMRISDEIRVANFEKANASSLQSFDTDFLHIAAVITEVDNKKVGIIEAYDFISKATPEDYAYIISYMNFYDLGVDPETPVSCKKCGGQTAVAVTFRPDFFVPKYSFE